MILRKPYAFFIKHFRLFHVLLIVLMFFSLTKTINILSFFNDCVKNPIDLIGQELSIDFIPNILFIVEIFIITISISILAVTIKKEKPKIFYIINIMIFIYNFLVLFVGKNVINKVFIELLDPRILRMVRDLYIFSLLSYIYPIVICLGRATGFDLKKFDFQRDIQELDIGDEDREEFEFQINYDKNNSIRKLRRKLRFFKYSIKENVIIYSCIFTAIIITITISSLNMFDKDETKGKIKKPININGFTITILDSFFTDTNLKGNKITDSMILPVRIKVKNNKKNKEELDLSTLKVVIDKYSFIPTLKHKDNLKDFGKIYVNDKIDNEEKQFVLIYEIPNQLIDEKVYFEFVDKYGVAKNNLFKKIKVKLNPQLLTKDLKFKKAYINEKLSFDDSLFNSYSFIINGISIQKEFRIDYNFCVKNNCYPSVEYLQPRLNTNYDKSIMQISGELFYEKEVFNFTNLYNFIEEFGTIEYKINDKLKIYSFKNNLLKSKKNNQSNIYYIEVPSEVEDADSISLNFTLRNKSYKYVLK